ncbi:MAG: hypothetical protein ABIK90_03490 [candidate division WOR-3 bacterium]
MTEFLAEETTQEILLSPEQIRPVLEILGKIWGNFLASDPMILTEEAVKKPDVNILSPLLPIQDEQNNLYNIKYQYKNGRLERIKIFFSKEYGISFKEKEEPYWQQEIIFRRSEKGWVIEKAETTEVPPPPPPGEMSISKTRKIPIPRENIIPRALFLLRKYEELQRERIKRRSS